MAAVHDPPRLGINPQFAPGTWPDVRIGRSDRGRYVPNVRFEKAPGKLCGSLFGLHAHIHVGRFAAFCPDDSIQAAKNPDVRTYPLNYPLEIISV